jgi:natural product precursor
MKKLGKLNINPEKVLKNEELTSLRGGYDGKVELWCFEMGQLV